MFENAVPPTSDRAQLLAERPDPRLPIRSPRGGLGHDAATAARNPGLDEPIGHAPREPLEVRIRLLGGRVGCREDQRVVLVRDERLLVTSLAPESEPCPRTRRITEFGDRDAGSDAVWWCRSRSR